MATRIGMMMGDPAGIGAELTAHVLAEDARSAAYTCVSHAHSRLSCAVLAESSARSMTSLR